MIIRKDILDKILEWSTPPYDVNERLDRNIVAALLVECVGGKKLAANEIESEVMDFISSKQPHTIHCTLCQIYSYTFYKIVLICFHRDNKHPSQIIRSAYACGGNLSAIHLCRMGRKN